METKSLIVFLNEIDDSRKAKGKRHEQLSILVIMIMAILCGKTSLKSIARFAKAHRSELIKYIPLPRDKVPSYSTIQRTSHRLDASKVCDCFNSWMQQHIKPEPIASDEKSITSTVQHAIDSEQTFASLVSFFDQISQLIYKIGFLENDKSSEIHLVQELIDKMRITKAIFTTDAIHCQKKQ